MRKKPAKIKASRRIRAFGVASLLREASRNGKVYSIDKTSSPYWRNAGSDQR